ncbi:MAG: hypothetical protein V3S35_06675 [Nitrosomonadaceae bacterium]
MSEQIVTKLKQIEVLMSQGKQILLLEKFFRQNWGKVRGVGTTLMGEGSILD